MAACLRSSARWASGRLRSSERWASGRLGSSARWAISAAFARPRRRHPGFPPESRERDPQQFVAGPIGSALDGDEQLAGRPRGGERAQLLISGCAGRQVGDDERVSGAQSRYPREQRGRRAERDGRDMSRAIRGNDTIHIWMPARGGVGAAAGHLGGEQTGIEQLRRAVGAFEHGCPRSHARARRRSVRGERQREGRWVRGAVSRVGHARSLRDVEQQLGGLIDTLGGAEDAGREGRYRAELRLDRVVFGLAPGKPAGREEHDER